jgi:uncharacterized protein (TIGR02996 family)
MGDLLAAVLEDPTDLDRRQVYADYLLSCGDPRGEFIALQLASLRGTLDRSGEARAAALLTEHGDTWQGGLAPFLVSDRTRFVAGFLTAARVKPNARPKWLLAHPIWATVEALELAPHELLRHPWIRVLRSISWTPEQLHGASLFRISGPTVEHLTVEDSIWVGAARPDSIRRPLEPGTLLPNLRSLTASIRGETTIEQLAWAWSGPLARRLHRVELQLARTGLLDAATCLRSLRDADASALAELILASASLRCRFVRGEGEWTRVELSGEANEMATELASLERSANLSIELSPF